MGPGETKRVPVPDMNLGLVVRERALINRYPGLPYPPSHGMLHAGARTH